MQLRLEAGIRSGRYVRRYVKRYGHVASDTDGSDELRETAPDVEPVVSVRLSRLKTCKGSSASRSRRPKEAASGWMPCTDADAAIATQLRS